MEHEEGEIHRLVAHEHDGGVEGTHSWTDELRDIAKHRKGYLELKKNKFKATGLRRSDSLSVDGVLQAYAHSDEAKLTLSHFCRGMVKGNNEHHFRGPQWFDTGSGVTLERKEKHSIETATGTSEVWCGQDVSEILGETRMHAEASCAFVEHIVEVDATGLGHDGENIIYFHVKFMDKTMDKLGQELETMHFEKTSDAALEVHMHEDKGSKWYTLRELEGKPELSPRPSPRPSFAAPEAAPAPAAPAAEAAPAAAVADTEDADAKVARETAAEDATWYEEAAYGRSETAIAEASAEAASLPSRQAAAAHSAFAAAKESADVAAFEKAASLPSLQASAAESAMAAAKEKAAADAAAAATAASKAAEDKAAAEAATAAKAAESAAPAAVPQASAGEFLTLEELKDASVWKARDVPPHEREQSLSDVEFQSVFGMSKDEFNKLAKFKRDKLKKENGLF